MPAPQITSKKTGSEWTATATFNGFEICTSTLRLRKAAEEDARISAQSWLNQPANVRQLQATPAPAPAPAPAGSIRSIAGYAGPIDKLDSTIRLILGSPQLATA